MELKVFHMAGKGCGKSSVILSILLLFSFDLCAHKSIIIISFCELLHLQLSLFSPGSIFTQSDINLGTPISFWFIIFWSDLLILSLQPLYHHVLEEVLAHKL